MWRHASSTDAINVEFIQKQCHFCKNEMIVEAIEDRWRLDQTSLQTEHETHIDELVKHWDEVYSKHRAITSEFFPLQTYFQCCPVCGWWCIIRMIEYSTLNMPYWAYQWAAGALTRQEFPEIAAPLSEIRSYLCARYDQRFLIDPWRLEDVVGSILRSFNCSNQISSRTHDGGIDIFGFDKQGRAFGIQVKRQRRRIHLEQIRSFVGALTLHGLPRGIFVTTSEFTSGASKLRSQSKNARIQLKYIDADKLFQMLKVAQIKDFDPAVVPKLARAYAKDVPLLNYGWGGHLNSL